MNTYVGTRRQPVTHRVNSRIVQVALFGKKNAVYEDALNNYT